MLLNLLTIFLLINSILLIGLILTQNETSKDATSNSGTIEISNPLQNFTAIIVLFQFLLFILKLKENISE
jgi:preprotein translocase subunit SecG